MLIYFYICLLTSSDSLDLYQLISYKVRAMANIQVCSLNSILYLCVNCLSLVYVIFNLSNTVKQQLLESFLQEVRMVATIQVWIFS